MLVVSVERCYACFMLSAARLKDKGPSWSEYRLGFTYMAGPLVRLPRSQ